MGKVLITIDDHEQELSFDDAWSFKDFSNRTISDVIPDGTVVYASSFYFEGKATHVFQASMRGVTFVRCNLDNCIIPPGNTTLDCSMRQIRVIDGVDWLVDENDEPIEAL